jgi:hypothetical protein
MTFNDTTILAALAALAIPLAIHLLGRRPARRMALPTARFAEEAHAASRGRTRLVRAALLAARLAAVAALVFALAGPTFVPAAPERQGQRPRVVGRRENIAPAPSTPVPRPSSLRILIVDAAGPEAARIRSADLVAATFAVDAGGMATLSRGHDSAGSSRVTQQRGQAAPPKQVARAKAAGATAAALAAADVVFWVGPQAPPDARPLAAYLARGGAVVWVPSDAAQGPDAALAAALGAGQAAVEDVAEGATIDPAGYTSDLVAAFEGGTSGDLGAPVLRRRLVFADAPARQGDAVASPAALRFRDGATAIAETHVGSGRAVLLAAGPAPAWGDLAGRAEFVVLTHALAEALARQRAPSAPREYTGGETAEGTVPAARRDPTLWFVLGLAAALAAESWLAARAAPAAAAQS